MFLLLCIYSCITIIVSTRNGTNIFCNTTNSCSDTTIQCNDNTLKCTINCIGSNACSSAHFLCPNNSMAICNILCDDGDESCSNSTIDASMSNELQLIGINGYNDSFNAALMRAVVMCPHNGLCNITGIGNNAMTAIKINAVNSDKLIVYAYTGSETLRDAQIYCPLISRSNDGSLTNCSIIALSDNNIYGSNNNDMISDLTIYHPDGLHSVYFSCSATSHYDCFRWNEPPQIYCNGNAYNSNCHLFLVGNDPNIITDKFMCNAAYGDGTESECFYNEYEEERGNTGNIFNCSVEPYYCYGAKLFCNMNEDCNVYCNNDYSCSYSHILCPKGNYSCNIYCESDGKMSCDRMIIDAIELEYGILNVIADKADQSMRSSDIICPNYGVCNINLGIKGVYIIDYIGYNMDILSGMESELYVNCYGYGQCYGLNVYLRPRSDITMDCDGAYSCGAIDIYYNDDNIEMDANIIIKATGDYVLSHGQIRCPDIVNNIFSTQCFIYIYGSYWQMMQGLEIFAWRSFDDIELICNYTHSYESNCAVRSNEKNSPLMACISYEIQDEYPSSHCIFQLMSDDHNKNDWECSDIHSLCAVTSRTQYIENIPIISMDADNYLLCNQEKQCIVYTYKCQDNMDCTFVCSGSYSCAYATFICPKYPYKCTVNIFGSLAYNLTIHATNSGTLIVNSNINGGKYSQIQFAKIYCPNYAHCNVTCTGNRACKDVHVFSQQSTKLFIVGDGEKVLDSMDIYCPNNSIAGFNDDCYVMVKGDSLWMLNQVKLYAIDGLNDIYIKCEYGSDGIYMDCFDRDTHLTMHCGDHYEYQCDMDMTYNTFDEFFITNNECECAKKSTLNPISTISIYNSNDDDYRIKLQFTFSFETIQTNITEKELNDKISNTVIELVLNYVNQNDLDSKQIDAEVDIDRLDGSAQVQITINTDNKNVADNIRLYAITDNEGGLAKDFTDTVSDDKDIPITVNDVDIDQVLITNPVTTNNNNNNNNNNSNYKLKWYRNTSIMIVMGIGCMLCGCCCMLIICYVFIKKRDEGKSISSNNDNTHHSDDRIKYREGVTSVSSIFDSTSPPLPPISPMDIMTVKQKKKNMDDEADHDDDDELYVTYHNKNETKGNI